MIKEIRKNYLI